MTSIGTPADNHRSREWTAERYQGPNAMIIRPSFVLSMLIAGICTGCAGTSFIKSPGQFLTERRQKIRQQSATRILCLWEAAEGQGLDGRPSRGFAGQILFFGSRDAAPIPVHGTVRIFEYENYDRDDTNPKPIHVFVFEDAAWNVHRAESTVGQAYNVFLPYVKRHKGLAACALKVEFVSDNGRTISSPITEITLDPRQSHSGTHSAMARGVIRQETPSPAAESPQSTSGSSIPPVVERQLDSLTIRLPRSAKQPSPQNAR
jgi:hypothetical protein